MLNCKKLHTNITIMIVETHTDTLLAPCTAITKKKREEILEQNITDHISQEGDDEVKLPTRAEINFVHLCYLLTSSAGAEDPDFSHNLYWEL
jgi:hypothetical protein